jgi:hypothetical protein
MCRWENNVTVLIGRIGVVKKYIWLRIGTSGGLF